MTDPDLLFDPRVAIFDTGKHGYPDRPPFNPPLPYPEYPFGCDEIDTTNFVYDAVRQLLALLGLDTEHFGTPDWNPLGMIVRPGDNVVLKPNLVISDHPDGLAGIQASVVQGSVVRALIDYVLLANRGNGRITIADSPIKEVDFKRILELTGVGPTVSYLNSRHNLGIELLDFRDQQVTRNRDRVMVASESLPGDPTGYTVVDLGQQSMLAEIAEYANRYRSTASVYQNTMAEAHNLKHNYYSIPNSILNADAVVSFAKLKTHRKAGVTLSLKNMVGITNEKRWLPHHRVGSPQEGGDLYADTTRFDTKLRERAKDILITHSWGKWVAAHIGVPLWKLYRHTVEPAIDRLPGDNGLSKIEDGDWFGNDTVWRMILDLNTVLFYADGKGQLQEIPQRHYFSVIDGIIGGMGEGPLKPTPAPVGVLVAGFNPVAVDMVCAHMMGFDAQRIPMIRQAAMRGWLRLGFLKPGDLEVMSNLEKWRELWDHPEANLHFRPSSGWIGHIERMQD